MFTLVLFSCSVQIAFAGSNYNFVNDGEETIKKGALVIDTRPLEECLKKSVRGARCLPVADFFGPHKRLASFVNIYWLLGTAGLSGQEHVLIVGDKAQERDFIGGIFFITGQKSISILTKPMRIGGGFSESVLGPGIERKKSRTIVYHGIARDKIMIFKKELANLLAFNNSLVVVDGRSESEFWGASVRGFRGGHIVGATHLPPARLRSLAKSGTSIGLKDRDIIIYGHNAYEGLALLTLMHAGFNMRKTRVYPGGWAEWSADSNMNANAVTYPERGASSEPAQVSSLSRPTWTLVAAALVIGMIFTTLYFFFFQRWGQK